MLHTHNHRGNTVKVTRYNAPVPVKTKTGRMPSELTVTLSKAIDDIATTRSAQRFDSESPEHAERVAVRIRQIASKKHVPVSVAIVQMDGKDVVLFGPREGYTPDDNHTQTEETESIAEITAELREILARLEKMSG